MRAHEREALGLSQDVQADNLEEWRAELKQVQYALSLWEGVGDREPNDRQSRLLIALDLTDDDYISDLEGLASLELEQVVSSGIEGLLRPYFSTYESPAIGLESICLLGEIWLTLAQAISENKTFRNCRNCATWFEIRPGVERKTRLYCSTACRIALHRRRQGEARAMHERGFPVALIATALEADVASVERWVLTPPGKTRSGTPNRKTAPEPSRDSISESAD